MSVALTATEASVTFQSHPDHQTWYEGLQGLLEVYESSLNRYVDRKLQANPPLLEGFEFLPYHIFNGVIHADCLFATLNMKLNITSATTEITERFQPIRVAIKAINAKVQAYERLLWTKERDFHIYTLKYPKTFRHCTSDLLPAAVACQNQLKPLVEGTERVEGIVPMLNRASATLERLSPLIHRQTHFLKLVESAKKKAAAAGERDYRRFLPVRESVLHHFFPDLNEGELISIPFWGTETDTANVQCIERYYEFYSEFVTYLSYFTLYLRRFANTVNSFISYFDHMPSSLRGPNASTGASLSLVSRFDRFRHPLFVEKVWVLFFHATRLPYCAFELLIAYEPTLFHERRDFDIDPVVDIPSDEDD